MTIHELDIAWARTASERRRLRWELSTAEAVRGAFLTAREGTLAVLFDGSRDEFAAWSDALISATYRLEGDTK